MLVSLIKMLSNIGQPVPQFATYPYDGALKDVVSAFEKDFPSEVGLADVVERLRNGGEIVTVTVPESSFYSGQILKPLQFKIPVKAGLLRQTKRVNEAPHCPKIWQLDVTPYGEFGYFGNVSLYDSAGDLKDFAVAVDGKLHQEGTFVRNDALGDLNGPFKGFGLAELFANGGMRIIAGDDSRVDVRGESLLFEYEPGRGGASIMTGLIHMFGDIPTGEHKLMLYVRDTRGNRAFAVTGYKI